MRKLFGCFAAKEKGRSFLLLAIIFIIAISFRLPLLSTIPNGFYCDEANNGYDAYSILMTGRDRHGKFMPLYPRSFGEYKDGANIYMTVPLIGLFGLNEFAVRLHSALMGLLTIGVLYLLVKEAFDVKTALAAAFFLSISSWHIQLSRVALQAILFPLPFCAALLFFLRGVKGSPRNLYLSVLFFCLSMWTFFAARAFVPLFFIILVILYAKELLKTKKHAGIIVGIFLIVFVMFLSFWLSPEGASRMNKVKYFDLAKNVRNYFSYFSPSFLFFRGDGNLRHGIPHKGVLHLFEIITVLVGAVVVLAGIKKKVNRIFLMWLILFPFPAIFSYRSATRSFSGVIVFAVLSGIGFVFLASLFRTPRAKKIFFTLSFLIILVSTLVYAKRYFYDYPRASTYLWQYGVREAITFAEKSSYDSIVISSHWGEKPLHQAYIFVLFYTKFDPKMCQRDIKKLNPWGRGTFGKYRISSIPKDLDVSGKALLIILPEETDKIPVEKYDWKVVHVITSPMGDETLKLVEVQEK